MIAFRGHQAEAILEEIMTKYKGQYILAVEGNPPLNEDGMFCIQSGKPFIEKLKHVAKDAKAIIATESKGFWSRIAQKAKLFMEPELNDAMKDYREALRIWNADEVLADTMPAPGAAAVILRAFDSA